MRCEMCGDEIETKARGRDWTYCSNRCRQQAYRQRQGAQDTHQPVTCPQCDTEFKSKTSRAKYCSSRCRTRAWRARK